ncbi:unnamed protein product [Ceutorhynchus assimilis]|uniref:THAP-type domain-containing protein n=1 Tax=Ceutorhynchus assimilis TaxID=467358 RepID=A0A9P0DIS9_9CUCU|nr:unnamed protein product [Ceutorhynchus assimilis]
MSNRPCMYLECLNNRNTQPLLSYYTFPVKDEKRCKTWILNSGNPKLLNMSETELKQRVICEKHFLVSSLRKIDAFKRTLNNSAVPVKYQGLYKDKTPSTSTSAPELREPEIKIEETINASLVDPLLLTYSKKEKSSAEPQQLPKKAVIKEFRRISPVWLNNLKTTKFKVYKSKITESSNKEADSSLQPKLKLPVVHIPDCSKTNVQISKKINAAPTIKVVSAPAGAESMFKYKFQSNPTLKLVSIQKPQVSTKIKTETVDLTMEDVNRDSTTNNSNGNDDRTVAIPEPQIPNEVKTEIIDFTLEDDPRESTTDNSNGNNSTTDFICKICSNNKSGFFFAVPTCSKALYIWRLCIRDKSLKSSDVVCESHFIKEDYLEFPPDFYSLGKLKPHVVPTSLGNIRFGCGIHSCINRYKNTSSMYAVPVWTDYRFWTKLIPDLANIDLDEILQYRVCTRHFDSVTEENMFNLKPTHNLSIEHELEQYLEKRRELQTLLGNQNDGACAFTMCNRKLGSENYKFPEDDDEAYDWLKLCKRTDILTKNRQEIKKDLKSQRLCSKHYNQIKSEASETFKDESELVKIEFSDDQIWDSEEKQQDDLVLEVKTYVPMRVYCAVINCSSYIKTAEKRYRFPLNQQLLRKWQKACGIADYINLIDFPNNFVCGKHFKKFQYNKQGILKRGSVPESYKNYIDPLANSSNFHWTRKSVLTKRKYIPKEKNSQPSISIDSNNDGPSIDFNIDSLSTDFDNDGPSTGKKRKVETTNPLQGQLLLSEKCCVKHCKSDERTVLFGFSNLIKPIRQLWIKGLENTAQITAEKLNQYSDKFLCLNHFEEKYRVNDTQLIYTAIPTLGLIDDSLIKLEPDTSVEWIKSEMDWETDECLSNDSVRSEAILHENSIKFPRMKRALKFGEEITGRATNAVNNKLPDKSRKVYQKIYGQFMDWRNTNNISSFSENDLTVYFGELQQKMKPSTVWTHYSIIKSLLNINHNVDISKYHKLYAMLMRKSVGFISKQSKTFSPDEIRRFLDEAPDKQFLFSKVAMIFGIMGACRRHELHDLKLENVQDKKEILIVNIVESKTKIRRTFTIAGKLYETCKKYMNLRPANCRTPYFFLNYMNGKCTVQNIGLNKFGNLCKQIATYLKLPDANLYTGHCFRRTSATILVDGSGDITTLNQRDMVDGNPQRWPRAILRTVCKVE